MVSENNIIIPYPPHERLLEILKGWRVVSKAKIFRRRYGATVNWNFQRGGEGGSNKKNFCGGGMDISGTTQ